LILCLVGVLYPPKNHGQQKNLWTNIYFNGNLGSDNRNCLAYYLLKSQHGDASEQFLKEFMIPPKFVDLMNGFWALDHFEFKVKGKHALFFFYYIEGLLATCY